MNKPIFIFILGLLLFFAGCRKPSKYYAIPDTAKQWAYFNPGSYWIFVNDSTTNNSAPIYDSLFVTAASITKHDQVRAGGPPEYSYERAEVKYTSVYYQSKPYVNFESSDDHLNVNYMENMNNNASINGIILAFDNNLHLISVKNFVHKALHTQLEVNGVMYPYVAQTEIIKDGKKFADFYIAKQKWIVKKIFYFTDDTVSWSVCRQKIVQ